MSKRNSSPYSDFDRYLFHQGNHFHSYQMLGAHIAVKNGSEGVRFAVWAPHAQSVGVVGDFNEWNEVAHPMERVENSGIWALFIPGLGEGTLYKYAVHANNGILLKADPYGFYAEVRPNTASIVYQIQGYQWQDEKWQKTKTSSYDKPMLIYEVHLGSWRQRALEEFLTYKELAHELIDYVVEMGYTHIELLPVVEHPFDGSWGYQATGYYAVTSRYGTPHDFMYLIDRAHQHGIGVILDWVPGHFCKDDHGLRLFDGTPTYEYADSIKAENHGWGTLNFDLGRPEVQSFLISNACFWLREFHIDGLRVDAVANMLYLDYERKPGQWRPNRYGGRENLEAIDFIRKLNEVVFDEFAHTLMMAEESTDWPLVSRPTYLGGLGFNYKWNMGWMNDVLKYMEMDPIFRHYHHNLLTFSFMYAFSENFVLPLSHDEVVHGKRSLLDKMPGDYWQKFAGLRALLAYMMAHPGKKLVFMGGEFGQFIEWKYRESLDWHLLEYPLHAKLHKYAKTLNHVYLEEASLWEQDFSWDGFEWIDPHDSSQSVVSFIRKGRTPDKFLIVVCNFTPEVRYDYRLGVPVEGTYAEILNTDAEMYGGSGQINNPELYTEDLAWHNQPYSLLLKLPPLAALYLHLLPEQ
ncbi:MAG: 1,4-alpha-glucan branching protein GlgB [Firmicutes bacterium]|nr:1,4-alpha-glucan branching protein GlgB [Bacillota bacterium]